MAAKAADFLIYDEAAGVYRENPEQAVRDDVEKHAWRHIALTIIKDWRLYLMLVPMLLVFLFCRWRSSISPASPTSRACWWVRTRPNSGVRCATPSC